MIFSSPEEFGDNPPPSLFHLVSFEPQIHWQQNSPTAKYYHHHATQIYYHCGQTTQFLFHLTTAFSSRRFFLCPCDQQQTSVDCWGAASRARCITFLPTGTQSVSVVSQVANISSPYISVCGFQFPNHKSGYNKTWQRDCLLPARPTSLAASEFVGCILWRTHFTEMSPLQTTKSEVIDVK